MQIILLLDHKALLRDDRKPYISVSPPCSGKVTIQGKTVRSGDRLPPLMSGKCSLIFKADGGEVYTDSHVIVDRNGSLRENIDNNRVIDMMVMLDQIARTQQMQTAQLNRLEGKASGGVFDLFRKKNNKEEKTNA